MILKEINLPKKLFSIQDTPNAVQRTQSLPSLSLLPPLWKPIYIKDNKSWLTKKGKRGTLDFTPINRDSSFEYFQCKIKSEMK